MENIETTLTVLRGFVSEIEENDFLRNHDERFGALRQTVEKNQENYHHH